MTTHTARTDTALADTALADTARADTGLADTALTEAPTGNRRATWMLNSLMVERAIGADTGGAYSVIETWGSAAGDPPPHVHQHEDEAFLVLEGTIDVTVGDRTTSVGPGGFAFGPRGVPHTYAVTSEVARIMVIANPAGSEEFFRAVGAPARSLVLPPPEAPDVPTVVATAARYGITVLPPPETA